MNDAASVDVKAQGYGVAFEMRGHGISRVCVPARQHFLDDIVAKDVRRELPRLREHFLENHSLFGGWALKVEL